MGADLKTAQLERSLLVRSPMREMREDAFANREELLELRIKIDDFRKNLKRVRSSLEESL